MVQRILVTMAVLLGVIGTAGPATAADTETRFNVSDSYFRVKAAGNLIWYNRSVQVGGTISTNPGRCTQVVYTTRRAGEALDQQKRGTCDEPKGHGFTLDANVEGGAASVTVDLWVENLNGHWEKVDTDHCVRERCV